jgi:septal ring factor EnvC (AmiA/AmiB activator)
MPKTLQLVSSRRILACLIAATWVVFTPAAIPAEDLRSDQIRRIEEELSRERDQYVKFDVKEKNLLGQLAEIEKRMAEKQSLLDALGVRIQERRSEVEESRKRLAELETEADEVRNRLGERVVVYYKYAKRGYVKLLATARDLDELRKRMYYLRIIMEEDRVLLETMTGLLAEQQRRVREVSDKLAAVSRLEEEEARQFASMEEDAKKKVFLLMKIHQEKEFYETAVQELQSAAESLKETLTDLDRTPRSSVRLTSDFAAHQGKLLLPFKGKIIENYHPLGTGAVLTHRGVFIQGKAGGEVRAIYDGRVDYSGWLKGYGQIIIINHGSRYYSVSAHLSARSLEQGDLVKGGDVIGEAGDSGSLSGPGLYFELRRGGETIDPLAWIKGR